MAKTLINKRNSFYVISKNFLLHLKEAFPTIQISYSKFSSLRPKWCILPGASGTHSVCVCMYHQNTKLLVDALNNNELTYKELIAKMVCSVEHKACMLRQCDSCPGNKALIEYLYNYFGKYEEEFQISYKQWQTVDRATLLSLTADIPSFIELLVSSLEILLPHYFIARAQSTYLNELKINLDEHSVIILGDFAENYAFIVQDEIQSYHWNSQQCSLHPLVIYYK